MGTHGGGQMQRSAPPQPRDRPMPMPEERIEPRVLIRKNSFKEEARRRALPVYMTRQMAERFELEMKGIKDPFVLGSAAPWSCPEQQRFERQLRRQVDAGGPRWRWSDEMAKHFPMRSKEECDNRIADMMSWDGWRSLLKYPLHKRWTPAIPPPCTDDFPVSSSPAPEPRRQRFSLRSEGAGRPTSALSRPSTAHTRPSTAQSRSFIRASKTVTVSFYMDPNCPWCYIMKGRLDAAVDEVRELGMLVNVDILPMCSFPLAREEGMTVRDYCIARWGGRSWVDKAVQEGRESGRNFLRWDYWGNSVDALRVIGFAKRVGSVEAQHELTNKLLEACFEKGKNLSDRELLSELADDLGIHGLLDYLNSDSDVQAVLNGAIMDRNNVKETPSIVVRRAGKDINLKPIVGLIERHRIIRVLLAAAPHSGAHRPRSPAAIERLTTAPHSKTLQSVHMEELSDSGCLPPASPAESQGPLLWTPSSSNDKAHEEKGPADPGRGLSSSVQAGLSPHSTDKIERVFSSLDDRRTAKDDLSALPPLGTGH